MPARSGQDQVHPEAPVQASDVRKLLFAFAETASIFTLRDFVRRASESPASRESEVFIDGTVSFQVEEPDFVSRERGKRRCSNDGRLLQIKEGLQRQEGRGTPQERTKTWSIESSTGVCGRSADR